MVIKDTAYASLFDKKDLPSLYELARRVRITHDQTLVDDFNLNCQKKVDDHNPILEIGNQKIEFVQVSKADDLVVTVGINRLLDQILGVSTVRWQGMGVGNGSTAPAIGQTNLVAGLIVKDMNLFGWREFAGPTLKFAAVFGETEGTSTVNESAIYDTPSTTILNRNIYTASPISHTINVQAFVVSNIIEFVPVMS